MVSIFRRHLYKYKTTYTHVLTVVSLPHFTTSWYARVTSSISVHVYNILVS